MARSVESHNGHGSEGESPLIIEQVNDDKKIHDGKWACDNKYVDIAIYMGPERYVMFIDSLAATGHKADIEEWATFSGTRMGLRRIANRLIPQPRYRHRHP
jgi:hypothetical protein